MPNADDDGGAATRAPDGRGGPAANGGSEDVFITETSAELIPTASATIDVSSEEAGCELEGKAAAGSDQAAITGGGAM